MSDDNVIIDGMGTPAEWPDRRPVRLLALIETRTAYMQMESQRVIEAYFADDDPEFARRFDLDLFQRFQLRASARALAPADLECYSQHWQSLVPGDPAIRAGIIRLLAQKYSLVRAASPGIQAALVFDDPMVQEAYRQTYGEPLEAVFRTEDRASAAAS